MKKMFKFMILGFSNVIPGVCSATIAMILNIYQELLMMLSSIYKVKNIKKYFFNYLGIIIGVVMGIFGLFTIYQFIPFILNMIFLGIVIKSYPLKIDNDAIYNIRKRIKFIYFWLGLLIVLILSLLNQQIFKIDYTEMSFKVMMMVFINGIIVAFGMILPGISGALMLVIFGLYFPLLKASRNILISIIQFKLPLINDFSLVFTFIISFILGLVLSSKLIKKIINEKPIEFNCLINGMILATIINLLLLVKSISCGIIETIFGIILMTLIVLFKSPKDRKESTVKSNNL